MAPLNIFISFFSCFLLSSGLGIHGAAALHPRLRREKPEAEYHDFRPTKLFVFGDSYVDTGNLRKSFGSSWSKPYGDTFPGKPAGRFSDGRVLTDYVAKSLGLKTPFAYEWMKLGGKKLRYGLNFAYGGSGVFDTLGDILPNMTTQIDFLERLVRRSVYTESDLQSSTVLVCLAGNDYGAYILREGSDEGLQNYIPIVINQLGLNLRQIRRLGPTKIVVTALQPLGCLPRMTQTSSFEYCNTTQNRLVGYHNTLLQQAIAQLNNETKSPTFIILDLYTAFTSVLQRKGDIQGDVKFDTLLKPCCMGIDSTYTCGSVDETDRKMYTVCRDPTTSFFWDSSHPTEAGWRAVYTSLEPKLGQFFKLYN